MKKDSRLNLMVSKETRRKLEELAKEDNRKVTSYIENFVLKEYKKLEKERNR